MRIWLLKDGELLPTDGTNVRLLRMGLLAEELIKRGHQIIWWTSSFNHFKKEFKVTSDKDINVAPNYLIKLLHGPGYQKNISFKRIFHHRVIAKKFLQAAQKEDRPDIILSALPTIEFALAATKYGKQHKVPVILDLRDMWPDIMVEAMPKFLRPFARMALEWQFISMRIACKDATGLTGITSPFLQWGLNYARRGQNRFDAVYPLGYSEAKLDDKYIQEAELFWKKRGLKLENKVFVISFIGSINKSFQLDVVIDAVKKMGNKVKLVIVGVGSELERYKKLTSNCSNIILTGWLDKAEISVLLKHSTLGIAPYIERKDFVMSLPNKIAEYLSAGLPIITNLPETSELGKLLLQHKCGFCYNPTDSCGLSAMLKKMQTDLDLLKQMSINARSLFEQKFIAEKNYSNMADHLEKIVKTALMKI